MQEQNSDRPHKLLLIQEMASMFNEYDNGQKSF